MRPGPCPHGTLRPVWGTGVSAGTTLPPSPPAFGFQTSLGRVRVCGSLLPGVVPPGMSRAGHKGPQDEAHPRRHRQALSPGGSTPASVSGPRAKPFCCLEHPFPPRLPGDRIHTSSCCTLPMPADAPGPFPGLWQQQQEEEGASARARLDPGPSAWFARARER